MKKQKRSEKLKFGNTIRQFRLAAGLSQDGLADRLDMVKSYISALENDHRAPSPEMLVRLGRALGVSAGAILDNAAEDYPDE